jgi:hypothetical protein
LERFTGEELLSRLEAHEVPEGTGAAEESEKER